MIGLASEIQNVEIFVSIIDSRMVSKALHKSGNKTFLLPIPVYICVCTYNVHPVKLEMYYQSGWRVQWP